MWTLGGLVAPPPPLRQRRQRPTASAHSPPDRCPPCDPVFVSCSKNFLLYSLKNHLSSFYVLDTVLSTEESAVNETDKKPAFRKLTGYRDDKQVNQKKTHKREEFGAEN